MGLEVFGPGDLYTHARGPNRVILNGASDNPGAPAMAEAPDCAGDGGGPGPIFQRRTIFPEKIGPAGPIFH